jgi:peptidoglycan/LPS O-acetylase OafA/YrhL|tara:strand:+ start:2876 stop:3958 length:1083 start_codon:yes stop_codon:yes gene_type:complete
MTNFRTNNFDLLRILAALQVVIFHGSEHLGINTKVIHLFNDHFLSLFPGVPIFFFISGFLIFASLKRNHTNLKGYFLNRSLRIFPALWVCVVISTIILFLEYPSNSVSLISINTLIWFFGQNSMFQFYTPEILRFWGVGTPNGSLWTITVELQFYIILPIIYFLIRKSNRFLLVSIGIIILSIVANIYILDYRQNHSDIVSKIGGVNISPYLYYFIIGAVVYKFWENIKAIFIGKFIYYFIAYLSFMLFTKNILNLNPASYWIESPFNLISDLLLAGLTFSFAYSNTSISEKILRGNDISYGLYIYHMIIINIMVQHNFKGSIIYLIIAIISTLIFALLSWKFIEYPALSLKKKWGNKGR